MSLTERQASEAIRILHVDDDIDFAEMATAFVEREDDRFEVETANSVNDGLARLADSTFDCIISDHDMPSQNGIEFLKAVREDYPELPFILYTGKGSEEVASDAISAGATDYMQKESGTDHFSVLAERIKTTVERTRAGRQRQQLTEAIETAREGIGIIDADGYHTAVNQAYADAYGTNPSELAGTHWTDLYPENEAEYMCSEVLPTVEEVGYWYGRTTGLRADGETFVQDCVVSATEQGATIRAVQDVSDEAESKEQLSRYQALIEVLKDPVYVLDEEGQFDFVNDAFVEKFGYERNELLGNGVSIIKDEQAVEQGLNNLRRVLSSDEPDSVYFETEIQPKSGESIPCEDHMTALPYEGDEFDGSVGILRDVSRQKERERELKRQNRRLDEFASVVSHDLRNPLAVAEGSVELLREECDSDRIDTIEQSLTRMSELIDDLLQLSRVGDDTESRESVSLAEIPKNCWQNVETGDATLQTKANRTIRADPNRLAQLFENLMRNAVEHTSQDVTVTVGELEEGFYVEDDGSGIPEDSRDDVFDAGHTTTDEGTGFGLSIVKEVAEAHGWEVSIAEGSEGGARFEITNVEFEPS
jgi:PAS domain S-box-containing protein